MIVEFDIELLGTAVNVIAIDALCERRLLQLLLDRFGLESLDTVWSHQPAGVNKARQFVTRVERALEQRVSRTTEMIGMT